MSNQVSTAGQTLAPPTDVVHHGRFAPSPTGPLHFGSLIAALGSFLMARSCGGRWLVRIEDLDIPRVVSGAADDILRTLESFGMHWDGCAIYQSRRYEHYQSALTQLSNAGLTYPCTCSRREVAQGAADTPTGMLYPGTCRGGVRHAGRPAALRLRTDQRHITFHDRIQGSYTQHLASAVGDFVIRRSDGLFAYQLAVVVDDAEQQITHIVRGSDLLDSTPRQLYLQQLLNLPTPRYSHLPLAVDHHGHKLSKQTRATPLDRRTPGPAIVTALQFLNQKPPRELARERLETIWSWALAHWRPQRIPAELISAGPVLDKTVATS
jgi:glutamyl-Q tRNA(Asp) synthetase